MWNLKEDTNELTYETKTDSQTWRVDLRLLGLGEMDWEFGVSRCQPLHIGWINNRVLLRSTGNCIQYPVINHTGKEYRKDYLYNWINFLCSIDLIL